MLSLAGLAEMQKGPTDGRIPFMIGDLFGPIRCAKCGTPTFAIWMTPDELTEAQEQSTAHPVVHVFTKGIGEPLCEAHRPVPDEGA